MHWAFRALLSARRAVRDPEFVAEAVKKYGDKIVVGIDAKSETVRTDGWLGDSGENYIAFAERMESIGVRHIIFTDIDKDGMLAGPNFDQLRRCAPRFRARSSRPAACPPSRISPA